MQGLNLSLPCLLALAGVIFPTEPPGKPLPNSADRSAACPALPGPSFFKTQETVDTLAQRSGSPGSAPSRPPAHRNTGLGTRISAFLGPTSQGAQPSFAVRCPGLLRGFYHLSSLGILTKLLGVGGGWYGTSPFSDPHASL